MRNLRLRRWWRRTREGANTLATIITLAGAVMTVQWARTSDIAPVGLTSVGWVFIGLSVAFAIAVIFALTGWGFERWRRSVGAPPTYPIKNAIEGLALPDVSIGEAVQYLLNKAAVKEKNQGEWWPYTYLDEAFESGGLTAWGQKCLNEIAELDDRFANRKPDLQFSGIEISIPKSYWKDMRLHYGSILKTADASQWYPHATFRRGNAWVHCYGHIRVNRTQLLIVFPPPVVKTVVEGSECLER